MSYQSNEIAHCCPKAGAPDWETPCRPNCDGAVCDECHTLWMTGDEIALAHPGVRKEPKTKICLECSAPFLVPAGRGLGREKTCSKKCGRTCWCGW